MDTKSFDLKEFMMFFNQVIFEKPPLECSVPKDKRAKNEVDTDTLIRKTTSIIRDHTNTIEQNVDSIQKVKITCGRPGVKLNQNQFIYGKYDYNILGLKKEGTGCLTYGCCPEVHQVADIKLTAIQDTLMKDTDRMVNNIISEVEQTINIKADDCGKRDYSPSIKIDDHTRQSIERRVKEIVKKEIDQDYTSKQEIEFNFPRPFVCVNRCDEPPRSSTINQEINVVLLAENIVHAVSEEINKTVVNKNIKADLQIADKEMNTFKDYLYSVLSCILIVVIYAFFYFLSYVILFLIAVYFFKKLGPSMFPNIIFHILTIVLMYLAYKFWKIIQCIMKGNGFFRCTGFWMWLKCTIKDIGKFILCSLGLPACETITDAAFFVQDIPDRGLRSIGAAGEAIFTGENVANAFGKEITRDPCASDEEYNTSVQKLVKDLVGPKIESNCKAI